MAGVKNGLYAKEGQDPECTRRTWSASSRVRATRPPVRPGGLGAASFRLSTGERMVPLCSNPPPLAMGQGKGVWGSGGGDAGGSEECVFGEGAGEGGGGGGRGSTGRGALCATL